MKEYAFFWGCQIPARFPFVELSTRKILDAFRVPYRDVDGFTCCPQTATGKLLGEAVWLATAARNLSVAERSGMDILTSCNGCYQSLKTANAQLTTSPQVLEEVNRTLAGAGIEYCGGVTVKHIIELLHEDISPAAITRKVVKPLVGMRVGVHHGCHLLRPSGTLRLDDPFEPVKFKALVNAVGAEPVDYETELLCCGGLLSDTGSEDSGLDMAGKKLAEMKGLGLDAMCLICPACFIQYDARQPLLKARGEEPNMPVIFYTELLGLALGFEPKELGLNRHAVKTGMFLRKWERNLEKTGEVKKHFDLKFLVECAKCKACVEECPAAQIIEGYTPTSVIEALLEGEIDKLLAGKEIWYCLECETCRELCPWKIGMSEIMLKLKRMAARKGNMPLGLRQAAKAFRESGAVAEVIEVSRKRLGLPPSKASGYEQLKKILDTLEEGE
jgi:CoB--CoM heterodisulfide reductase subunit B